MGLINELTQPGWVDLQRVLNFLDSRKIQKSYGKKENVTDGEAHWICRSRNGKTFELIANYYKASTFKELLDWADKC